MTRFGIVFVLFTLTAATGCTFRGIPTHGGGKRFYIEQELLAKSAEAAMANISFDGLENTTVRLEIHAIGGEGGGFYSGGRTLFGLGAGAGAGDRAGDVDLAGSAAVGATNAQAYGVHAFANSGDLEYLKGLIMKKLAESNISLLGAGTKAIQDYDVHVLVPIFGTNKWTTNYLVFWREQLRARVELEVFSMPGPENRGPGSRKLRDAGQGQKVYTETHVLGIAVEEEPNVGD